MVKYLLFLKILADYYFFFFHFGGKFIRMYVGYWYQAHIVRFSG